MTEPPITPDDRLSDIDDFDLQRLITALRGGWLIILGCALASVLIEGVRLHGAPLIYGVNMEVAAVQAPSVLGAAAPPDRRGGDPYQQGRRGADHDEGRGSRGPSVATPLDFTLYLESLRTRDVADVLAKDPQIAQALFLRAGQSADGAQVQRYLLGQLAVNQDQRKHTFATLRLQSARPDATAHLLLVLHQAADDHMRAIALARSRQMISDLSAAPNTDANPAIPLVLAEQQHVEAAALSTAPFAAQRIGGPAVEPRPLNRPVKSLISALVVGGTFGGAIALLVDWLRRSRRRAEA